MFHVLIGITELTLGSASSGDAVNAWVDDGLSLGSRLLEMPVFMLLGAIGAVGVALSLGLDWAARRRGRPGVARAVTAVAAFTVGLAVVALMDRRIARLQEEVAELRTRQGAALTPVALPPRQTYLCDVPKAHQSLEQRLGEVSVRPAILDRATDLIQIHIKNPLLQVFLAVVDLKSDTAVIEVGGDLTTKTLTSTYARQNACTLAINGEAGLSPQPGSGLGDWQGYMMKQGQLLLRERAGVRRPFISWDRHNHATFRALAADDRALPADAYNVFWGRLDSLIGGIVQTTDDQFRQPRTAMGIDADGTRLYLMVIDGRQPLYSGGSTRAEVGEILQAFGATDAMLCDQGGSSCLYAKAFGGIVNVPSDNMGSERTTYTHFGVTVPD